MSQAPHDDPAGPDERLAALRRELEQGVQQPVSERLAVFESVNAQLAAELGELDEL